MAQNENRAKNIAFPMLWALLIVIVGVMFLLSNFSFLANFNVVALLPLLLVVAGAQILLRGDFLPSSKPAILALHAGVLKAPP